MAVCVLVQNLQIPMCCLGRAGLGGGRDICESPDHQGEGYISAAGTQGMEWEVDRKHQMCKCILRDSWMGLLMEIARWLGEYKTLG